MCTLKFWIQMSAFKPFLLKVVFFCVSVVLLGSGVSTIA